VALLTPSGIAADKGAAPFFKGISDGAGWGPCLISRTARACFPDVDSRFKFCTLVFGGPRSGGFEQTRCAFYLHRLAELDEPERTLLA
jgi:hypothetical protein